MIGGTRILSEREVLTIGLDGATWDVLNPLMKKGYMPNLRKMAEEGTSGILKSTKPPIRPVVWSSFQSVCNPGKHGVFDFTGYDRKNSETFFVNSTSIRVPTIWELLSSMDKKIIAINVPLTYPPKKSKWLYNHRISHARRGIRVYLSKVLQKGVGREAGGTDYSNAQYAI